MPCRQSERGATVDRVQCPSKVPDHDVHPPHWSISSVAARHYQHLELACGSSCSCSSWLIIFRIPAFGEALLCTDRPAQLQSTTYPAVVLCRQDSPDWFARSQGCLITCPHFSSCPFLPLNSRGSRIPVTPYLIPHQLELGIGRQAKCGLPSRNWGGGGIPSPWLPETNKENLLTAQNPIIHQGCLDNGAGFTPR